MAKWLSKEALQVAEKRREAKDKGKKERYAELNAEFQRIARRDKKTFLWDFPVHQPQALVSCIQPGLVICFTLDNIHVSITKPLQYC